MLWNRQNSLLSGNKIAQCVFRDRYSRSFSSKEVSNWSLVLGCVGDRTWCYSILFPHLRKLNPAVSLMLFGLLDVPSFRSTYYQLLRRERKNKQPILEQLFDSAVPLVGAAEDVEKPTVARPHRRD